MDSAKDVVYHTTHPHSAKVPIGQLAKPQLPSSPIDRSPSTEPAPGQVYLANVFGHYMLTHWLSPLFDSQTRINWVGSICATADALHLDDIQGLKTNLVYEGSKRLIELLVLTSELPSTASSVKDFLAASDSRPKIYITHPGVCPTSIAALGWPLTIMMGLMLYASRLLGSRWHVVGAYKGAVSIVHCAIAPFDQLDERERVDGKGKWRSVVSARGHGEVLRADTEGWGYCGKVDVIKEDSMTSTVGKYRLHQPLTLETQSQFGRDGERAWKVLEQIKNEWNTLLRSNRSEERL